MIDGMTDWLAGGVIDAQTIGGNPEF